MLKYKVYADATADIPHDICERYHIHTLGIPVTIGEQTFMSGIEVDNDTFYQMLESYDGIPVTSQITPYAFEELFDQEWKNGTEALLVFLLNGKGSATYNNAVATRERFYALNPEASNQMSIYLFDGASYSAGYGYAAILAAQKLEMGSGVEEVVQLAQEQIRKQRIYFGLYSLRYAGKSGRIPSAAVFVGEALGIKPIMQLWDHAITTIGKARGEKKLIKELVKMTMDDMEPSTPYCVLYAHNPDDRDEMIAEISKKIGYPPVYVFQVGPTIAANIGPRGIGVAFEVAKKKLEKENKIK